MDDSTAAEYRPTHRRVTQPADDDARRSIAERLGLDAPRVREHPHSAWRPTWERLRSPQFVTVAVAIGLLGGVLAFVAVSQAGDAVAPATVVPAVVDAPAGGFFGARFSLR